MGFINCLKFSFRLWKPHPSIFILLEMPALWRQLLNFKKSMKMETRFFFFFVLDFIGTKWGENLIQYSQLMKNMLIDNGRAPGPNLHSKGTDISFIIFYESQIVNWQFFKSNHCSCFLTRWLSSPHLPTGYLC